MYRDDLLFEGNRISEEELGKILNPIKEDELDKYDSLLNLEGMFKDIEDFYEKFFAYIQTGNAGSYDKNYEIVEETKTVTRYHKKIPTLKPELVNDEIELEQTSDNDIWIDCMANDEGAVAYDYTYTFKKLIQKSSDKLRAEYLTGQELFDSNLKSLVSLGLSLPENLKALDTININDTIKNLVDLKEIFIDNPQFSNRVCIMLIDCILESLYETIGNIELKYKNKTLINITELIKQLPALKANWIACYNAYEKSKNFGFSGYKKANESDIDEGYSLSYEDLLRSVI